MWIRFDKLNKLARGAAQSATLIGCRRDWANIRVNFTTMSLKQANASIKENPIYIFLFFTAAVEGGFMTALVLLKSTFMGHMTGWTMLHLNMTNVNSSSLQSNAYIFYSNISLLDVQMVSAPLWSQKSPAM